MHKSPVIEVRIPGTPSSSSMLTARCVWDGRCPPKQNGDSFDVAVLECDLPAAMTANIPLLEQMPDVPAEAYGHGFPLKARRDDLRRPMPVIGKIGPFPSAYAEFEFHGEDKLKDPKDWAGISGGPIFAGGKLAGVIIHYRDTHSNDHFRVVAICRLLRTRSSARLSGGWIRSAKTIPRRFEKRARKRSSD